VRQVNIMVVFVTVKWPLVYTVGLLLDLGFRHLTRVRFAEGDVADLYVVNRDSHSF
jgi:hypothetical protein